MNGKQQSTTPRRRRTLRQAGWGHLLCLCFALQLFSVPLHLALSDHTLASVGSAHIHTHQDAPHQQAPHSHDGAALPDGEDPEDGDEGHRPHPVEDHLDQLAEPELAPTQVRVAWALSNQTHSIRCAAPRDLGVATFAAATFRPPPEVRSSATRAPPIA